ncbi:MAG: hypothetical protein OXG53_12360 [Chloroflexi bacterium]|nr:hypothetical protein [Chloroflexota bacterium]
MTASNLLVAHVAFHVIFVFGYWFSVIASLSFSGLDFLENHLLAFLTDAASNHLALLLVLIIHTLVFVANRWRKQRKQGGEISQYNEEFGHLTAEEKLELLLDEVVELREAMHDREVVNQTRNPDLAAQRLRERDQEAEEEMILLDEYQEEKAREGS